MVGVDCGSDDAEDWHDAGPRSVAAERRGDIGRRDIGTDFGIAAGMGVMSGMGEELGCDQEQTGLGEAGYTAHFGIARTDGAEVQPIQDARCEHNSRLRGQRGQRF